MAARAVHPEIIDQADDGAAQASLGDMARINRWFGGQRIALRLIGRAAPRDGVFRLLDIGAGCGEAARAILRKYPRATVVSLDLRPRNLRRARDPRVAADAFQPPFADGAFDIVFCSLFLHHFSDDGVVRLLEGMSRLARRAVVAVDLERHAVARNFLGWTRWAMGWNAVTMHDGPASVASAFTRAELESLAQRAGLRNSLVRRHRPWFRVSLYARNG